MARKRKEAMNEQIEINHAKRKEFSVSPSPVVLWIDDDATDLIPANRKEFSVSPSPVVLWIDDDATDLIPAVQKTFTCTFGELVRLLPPYEIEIINEPTDNALEILKHMDLKKRSVTVDDIKSVITFIQSNQAPIQETPEQSLIIPAVQSIIRVNQRLVDEFRLHPEHLQQIDPFVFEHLVGELFEEEGYEVIVTPKSKDGGKDLYVYKTDNMLKAGYLVECKRYTPPKTVGVPIARQVYGVAQKERLSGVIITTSYFTQEAKEFAASVPYQLSLKDIKDLHQWLARGQ